MIGLTTAEVFLKRVLQHPRFEPPRAPYSSDFATKLCRHTNTLTGCCQCHRVKPRLKQRSASLPSDEVLLTIEEAKLPPRLEPEEGESITSTAAKAEDASAPRDGTLFSSTAILINSIVGSSILAIPWALGQCGWVLGLVLLGGCAAVTYLGAVLLIRCAKRLTAELPQGESIHFSDVAAAATPRAALLPEVSRLAVSSPRTPSSIRRRREQGAIALSGLATSD
jgi:hypothetical protein